jgi:hypothetical protein
MILKPTTVILINIVVVDIEFILVPDFYVWVKQFERLDH